MIIKNGYMIQEKHYGLYLPFAGNSIKEESNDIENLYLQYFRLQKQLEKLKNEIQEREEEFLKLVKTEWEEGEIIEAKSKAKLFSIDNLM